MDSSEWDDYRAFDPPCPRYGCCCSFKEIEGSETSGVVNVFGTINPDLAPDISYPYTLGQLRKLLIPRSWTKMTKTIPHGTILGQLIGDLTIFTTQHRIVDVESGRSCGDRVGEAPPPTSNSKPRQDGYSGRDSASADSETSDGNWTLDTAKIKEWRSIATLVVFRTEEIVGRLPEKEVPHDRVDGYVSAGRAEHGDSHSTKAGRHGLDISGGMGGHPGLSRPHANTHSWLGLLSMWLLSFGTTLRCLLHASPIRPRRHLPPTSHTLLAPLFLCLLAGPLSASAQRQIPPALLHIAAGTSFTTSVTIPPLRVSDNVPAPWWMGMYAVWGVAFTCFLAAELVVRPTWAQRRLLAGLFLVLGLNLAGSLVQGGDSILEGMASWGPLAMTASLWLVPVLMEAWDVRRAGGRAEGAVQAVELVVGLGP